MSPCPDCGAPIVTYPDNGEVACAEDASHDLNGGSLADDEMPHGPSDAEEAFDPDDPLTYPPEQPWEITNDSLANWAIHKIKRARFELDRIAAMEADEIDRIRTRCAQLRKGPERDEEFFTDHLARYMRAKQERGEVRGKTYSLVNGDIKTRAGSTVVNITDPALALDFAEGHGRVELLNVKVTPNKPALKKALEAGEEIPGVELVRNEDSYSVVVNAGEPPSWLPMPTEGAA